MLNGTLFSYRKLVVQNSIAGRWLGTGEWGLGIGVGIRVDHYWVCHDKRAPIWFYVISASGVSGDESSTFWTGADPDQRRCRQSIDYVVADRQLCLC